MAFVLPGSSVWIQYVRLASHRPVYTQIQYLPKMCLCCPNPPAFLNCWPPTPVVSSWAVGGTRGTVISAPCTGCTRSGRLWVLLCGQGPSLLEWTRWCHEEVEARAVLRGSQPRFPSMPGGPGAWGHKEMQPHRGPHGIQTHRRLSRETGGRWSPPPTSLYYTILSGAEVIQPAWSQPCPEEPGGPSEPSGWQEEDMVMATDKVVEKQGTRGRGAMGAEVGEGAGSQWWVPSP